MFITMLQKPEARSFESFVYTRNSNNLSQKIDTTINPKLQIREGKHWIAYHMLSWDTVGSAIVKKIDVNKYSIKGKQIHYLGFLTIDGVLTPLENGLLGFDGIIVSRSKDVNDGFRCKREGKFTFMVKPGKKYWRLQEMENCQRTGFVDYIDISF